MLYMVDVSAHGINIWPELVLELRMTAPNTGCSFATGYGDGLVVNIQNR